MEPVKCSLPSPPLLSPSFLFSLALCPLVRHLEGQSRYREGLLTFCFSNNFQIASAASLLWNLSQRKERGWLKFLCFRAPITFEGKQQYWGIYYPCIIEGYQNRNNLSRVTSSEFSFFFFLREDGKDEGFYVYSSSFLSLQCLTLCPYLSRKLMFTMNLFCSVYRSNQTCGEPQKHDLRDSLLGTQRSSLRRTISYSGGKQ